MKRLQRPQEVAKWLRTQVHGVLQTDSRRVREGDGFVAWPGGVTDGRGYVTKALQQGARACLVEHAGAESFEWANTNQTEQVQLIASYEGLKAASGPIAAAYYEEPSRELDVIAITGTNGKTSSAWWLAHALKNLGKRCAVVGTLGIGEVGQVNSLEFTGMTTPDPVLLQARLRDMVNAGVQACAIEASSIGLAEHRLDGTQVHIAMFTNFTQDHLDYHGDMAHYWNAKFALFGWQGLKSAVINVDDHQGAKLVQQLNSNLSVWTISCEADSSAPKQSTETAQHIVASNITHGAKGLCFDVHEGISTPAQKLETRLVGHYNVSNVLGVIACLRAMGYSLANAVEACCQLPPVPGRMQAVEANDDGAPLVVVDYAHTPDAIVQAVQALLPLAQSRGGELTCILGCGGDRDATKRPLMAAAAEQFAHHVVLTSDNPRSEDPENILQDMRAGLVHAERAKVMTDRAQAIAEVVLCANEKDVILVAGKGHEEYQEIAGVKHPFSDIEHAYAALKERRLHV